MYHDFLIFGGAGLVGLQVCRHIITQLNPRRIVVASLKERGNEISNGYGDLKGKTFRIGHMRDHTEAGLEELLGVMDEVLAG